MKRQKSQKGVFLIMKRKIYQQLIDWKEQRHGEVALLIEGARRIGKSRHNIRPIEVKSGKNYTLSSLNKALRKFSEPLTTPTVIHTSDLKSRTTSPTYQST